jgi:vacuolar protein sorting-associated protein 41
MATKEEDNESSYEEYSEGDEFSEEEEEEDEPKLKYQRLGFSVIDILKTDSASCMGVHEKFLVSLGLSKRLLPSVS